MLISEWVSFKCDISCTYSNYLAILFVILLLDPFIFCVPFVVILVYFSGEFHTFKVSCITIRQIYITTPFIELQNYVELKWFFWYWPYVIWKYDKYIRKIIKKTLLQSSTIIIIIQIKTSRLMLRINLEKYLKHMIS